MGKDSSMELAARVIADKREVGCYASWVLFFW